jgi:hypothetical protein
LGRCEMGVRHVNLVTPTDAMKASLITQILEGSQSHSLKSAGPSLSRPPMQFLCEPSMLAKKINVYNQCYSLPWWFRAILFSALQSFADDARQIV